ncbi:MAG: hypothetical protein AAFR84_14015 [Pseudomonadota bacterium]
MADAYDFWAERLARAEQAVLASFWEHFARHAAFLYGIFSGTDRSGAAGDVAECMTDALGPLADEIFWEFSAADEATGDDHFLALTPELYHAKRPLARALIAAAPDLPGWKFGDARPPPQSDERLLENVAARAFRDVTLVGAAVREGTHRTVDVLGFGADGVAGDEPGDEAGLLFSLIVGEALERDWLGEIATEPASATRVPGIARLLGGRDQADEAWTTAFAEEARALLAALQDSVPQGPFAPPRDSASHALYDLAPTDGAWPRADLFRYATTRPDYAKARFDGAPIAAARFTRAEESLIGLRVARTPIATFDAPEELGRLAGAIDADLRRQGLGGVFGEGLGRAHAYVDAAVNNIPLAIATIERRLGQFGLGGPSHLLFDELGLNDLTLPLSSTGGFH